MSARALHAVVAAGLRDPRLLGGWAADPAALGAYGSEAAGIDLAGLSGFAGLTAKVRHNGLRDDFPLTFRLLAAAGLEARLFTDYLFACAREGRAFAPAPARRGAELADFILAWADPRSAAGALLIDVVRHERALARLRCGGPGGGEAKAVPRDRPLRLADVPVLAGEIELLELGHDPDAIAAELCRAEPALGAVAPSPALLGYRRAPDGTTGLLRLDAFSFAFLGLVDGEASIGSIAAALGLPPAPPVAAAAGQLAEAGLIALRGTRTRP